MSDTPTKPEATSLYECVCAFFREITVNPFGGLRDPPAARYSLFQRPSSARSSTPSHQSTKSASCSPVRRSMTYSSPQASPSAGSSPFLVLDFIPSLRELTRPTQQLREFHHEQPSSSASKTIAGNSAPRVCASIQNANSPGSSAASRHWSGAACQTLESSTYVPASR
ncbi:hypothetical protein BJX62DRAFT_215450 [Aspergillus germanicus]